MENTSQLPKKEIGVIYKGIGAFGLVVGGLITYLAHDWVVTIFCVLVAIGSIMLLTGYGID